MHTLAHFHFLPHHRSHSQRGFFLATVIRTFVISYLIVFLPILLLTHFEWAGTRLALAFTGMYLMALAIVQISYVPIVAWVAHRGGLRSSFFAGYAFLLLFIGALFFQMYFISMIVLGFASIFWWYSYHLYFTQYAKVESYGRNAGFLDTLSVLSGAVAPGIGGYVLGSYGEMAFYLLGGAVLFTGFVFVAFIPANRTVRSVSYRGIWDTMRARPRDLAAFVGAGAEEAIGTIIWPLLLYFLLRDITRVGSYFTFVWLAVAVATYMVGLLSDRAKQDTLEEIGSTAVFGSWLLRVFFQHPAMLGLVEVVYKLFLPFFKLPLLVIAYHHAFLEKETYIAFREVSYKVGALLGYVAFVLIAIFGFPLWAILLVSAGFSLLPLRVRV